MARINDNYLKLKAGYLFPEINRRVKAFAAGNPSAKIIRMGIGDVTEPLPPACVEAMHRALDELSRRETFRIVSRSTAETWASGAWGEESGVTRRDVATRRMLRVDARSV